MIGIEIWSTDISALDRIVSRSSSIAVAQDGHEDVAYLTLSWMCEDEAFHVHLGLLALDRNCNLFTVAIGH